MKSLIREGSLQNLYAVLSIRCDFVLEKLTNTKPNLVDIWYGRKAGVRSPPEEIDQR